MVTDSFKAYKGLSGHGYYHYSVNHKKHFVAPESAAHTQRIERAWSHVRKEALPLVGCRLPDVGLFLAAYLYRRSRQGNILTLMADLKKSSKAAMDEYTHERAKLIKAAQSKKTTTSTPSNETKLKAAGFTRSQRKASRVLTHVKDESAIVLRHSRFTNTTALTKREHDRNLQNKREEIPQRSADSSAAIPVEFDILHNSQVCVEEINKDSKDPKKQKKKQPPKKRIRILPPSRISTRSQTRKCLGRTPGFYAKRK